MPFVDELDEFPKDDGLWTECDDCGEDYDAMENGECPYCGDDADEIEEEGT